MSGSAGNPFEVAPDTGDAFATFCEVIATLRAPDGCPWDRSQTHRSIANNMTEEAAEAVEAIERDDSAHLCEELGDVLLQVVLQAQMAAEAGEFTILDVLASIQDKMVRRHPHVFGAQASLLAAGFSEEEIAEATTPDKVNDLWGRIKAKEREAKERRRTEQAHALGRNACAPLPLLDDIPRSLPALQQAQKISNKAVAAGFEWDTVADVWDKVDEEIVEFHEAAPGSPEREEEFGDVLFTLVNVARKEDIDAERALRGVCGKFRERWAIMERRAYEERGQRIETVPREQLELLWDEAKAELRKDL